MKPHAIQKRLARLKKECEVSVAPGILLFAACSALVLALGVGALTDPTTAAQAGQLTKQEVPPAA